MIIKALFSPLIVALYVTALVKSGHGLVRGASLNLHKVGLLVRALRTLRFS